MLESLTNVPPSITIPLPIDTTGPLLSSSIDETATVSPVSVTFLTLSFDETAVKSIIDV